MVIFYYMYFTWKYKSFVFIYISIFTLTYKIYLYIYIFIYLFIYLYTNIYNYLCNISVIYYSFTLGRLFWGSWHVIGLFWWLSSKESRCNAEDKDDVGSIPGSGRFSGEGYGNWLQNSCWGNPHGQRDPWWDTVHRITRVRNDLASEHTCMHTCDYSIFQNLAKYLI